MPVGEAAEGQRQTGSAAVVAAAVETATGTAVGSTEPEEHRSGSSAAAVPGLGSR